MAAKLKVIWIVLIILPVTIGMAVFQLVFMKLSPSFARKLPVLWHRLLLRLIGVRVFIHGEIARDRPLMIVSNHVSWSDILILGSIGELCFIAKDEVRELPGINWLARMQRTVFVKRERRREVGIQADTIAARLVSGDPMVLFAEGTTGNGNRLAPFKSALFGAPQMALAQSGVEAIHIQPVAIAYNTLHGMPLGRYHQTYASWPGDIELGPHLKDFLRLGAFDVDVSLGETIMFDESSNRKQVANDTYTAVRNSFARLRRSYHKS